MKILTPELFAIVTVGLALAALILNATGTMNADRRALQANAATYRAEAAADRRALRAELATYRAEATADRTALRAEAAADRTALQNAMQHFREEMLRLSERQSRLEATQEAQASNTTAGS